MKASCHELYCLEQEPRRGASRQGAPPRPCRLCRLCHQVTGTVPSIHTECEQTRGSSLIQQPLVYEQGKVQAIALYPRLYLSLQTARTAGLAPERVTSQAEQNIYQAQLLMQGSSAASVLTCHTVC